MSSPLRGARWRGRRAQGVARAYARATRASLRAPWRDADFCVVDLELSGLDPRAHEIISFGAVPIEDGRVRLGGASQGLVRPTRPLAEEAILVHGIRAADLADAPPLEEALEALLLAMTGRILIAHHASVERGFLTPALRRAGVRLRGPVIDTVFVARLWLAERDGYVPGRMTLAELASACGLPAHSPHTAMGDALTTAQLFIAAATHLDARRSQTVRDLSRADTRLSHLASFAPAPPAERPAITPR